MRKTLTRQYRSGAPTDVTKSQLALRWRVFGPVSVNRGWVYVWAVPPDIHGDRLQILLIWHPGYDIEYVGYEKAGEREGAASIEPTHPRKEIV